MSRESESGLDGNEASSGTMAKGSSAISLHYPMLTESNYAAWAIKMKVYMKAQGVWDAIENGNVDMRKDQMALAAIYQGIPEETLFLLAEKETAKAAWEALKEMHLGADRVKEAKVQTLKTEFEVLRMKETESINDFAVRLTVIVNKIRGLGEKVEELYVVKKFLRAIPSQFLPIASVIEQFGDLKAMTMEEVIGRLKAYEERIHDTSNKGEGQLLLTRAEWEAQSKREGKNASRGDGNGRKGRRFDKAKVRCYNCNDYGHFASECPKPKTKKAFVAEALSEDEVL